MAAISLKPTRHELPVCTSFEDEQVVRDFEVSMRIHRAYTEAFTITADDNRVDGSYSVSSQSGSAWRVDIVDASGRSDTCSCPDFLTNEINTCKHLEAVRRMIDASTARRKAFDRLPMSPRTPTLTVDGRGGAHLKLAGKWPELLLGTFGLKRVALGDVVEPLRESDLPLRPGVQAMGVRVVHAATGVIERLRSVSQSTRRRDEIDLAAERGGLAFDVLSKPLFPYQRTGVLHLVRTGRALLADDMGLGKTAQTIAACEVLRARGEAKRILIVTPASLKHQWAREIATFTSEKAVVVGGSSAARTSALQTDAPYKILNYELTWRELTKLQSLDADVLVLDEAQRAKNFRTKTAATLRSIPSRFLFVLTGTPVENRLDDLYSLLQLVDPTLMGPLWKFNYEFHRQSERGKVVGYKNLPHLRQRISGTVLRRRKEEVISQLPALTELTRYTPITAEQKEFEEGCRGEAAKLMKIAENRPLTLQQQQRLMAMLLKARQACNALELADPTLGEASPKLDEFENILSELAQGTAKVLVFSEWTEMLKLAAARLDGLGIGHSMLHGGVATDKRPALLERFRTDPSQRVLLSTDAGGVGLNLQVATYVIHLDLPWNPGRLDQRTARAHRVGQTRGVSVIYLCAESGIERGIEGTLAGKRAVRSAALDADSSVDELEAPSFSVFLRQIQTVLLEMEEQPASNDDTSSSTSSTSSTSTSSSSEVSSAVHRAVEAAIEGVSPSTVRSDQLVIERGSGAPQLSLLALDDGSPTASPGSPGASERSSDSASGITDTNAATIAVPSVNEGGAHDHQQFSLPGTSIDAAAQGASSTAAHTNPTLLSNADAVSAMLPSLTTSGTTDAQDVAAPTQLAPTSTPAVAAHPVPRASDAPAVAARSRLRFATVVLEAGFPADAVRAAYEALARAVTSLIDGAPPTVHAQLVAMIYRDLLPQGKLPPAAHSALARLHDLMSLEQHGVDVEMALAREAVGEAKGWVERLVG